MFLHIGDNVVIPMKDIIGIFDLENTMYGNDTVQFLRMAEEDGFVEDITEDEPKSFIVAEVDDQSKVYLSAISASTLAKRSRTFYDKSEEI